MPRLSATTTRIGGRGAEAWAVHARAKALEAAGETVFLLSVGDPDFATPAPVIEAAHAAMLAGRTHYSWLQGDPLLRRDVADLHAHLIGRSLDADQVVIFPGAQAALFATAQVLFDPGDEVIAPAPTYVTYEGFLGAAGARLVTVPLDRARGFALDPDAIARAITPATRGIVLNSPHNPTGAVFGSQEIAAVAALARQHDLWVLSDEVYASLVFDRPHVSPLAFPDMAERTVVISSLSKSHAMTGWRVGWAVAPPPVAQALTVLVLCMLYGSPGFIQAAGVTALRDCAGDVARMRDAYRARRDLVLDRLGRRNDLACVTPEGGMFVMVDCRGSGLDATSFANRCLDTQRVSLLPGDGFGPGGEGHLRLGLVYDLPRLDEACRRILAFADSL